MSNQAIDAGRGAGSGPEGSGGSGGAGRRRFALARLCASCAAALVLAPGTALAGETIGELRVEGQFIVGFAPARWDARALPVAWRIHRDGVINNANNGNTTTVTVADAVAALEGAFNQWTDIPGSTAAAVFDRECRLTGLHPGIECLEGRTSTFTAGLDGENIVTWADPQILGSGILASTFYFALRQDLVVGADADRTTRDLDGDGAIDLSPALYPPGTVLPAGTIVDGDIAFNSSAMDWITYPVDSGSIADIVGIGLHEQGHFFGLAHSPLWGPFAVMFPFNDLRSLERQLQHRTLAVDDKSAARRFYPEEPYLSQNFGTIRGRLVNDRGEPIAGEPVIAIDASTLDAVAFDFTAHALSEYEPAGAGSFAIEGLPPGEYFVQVGALDASFFHLERERYTYQTIYTDYPGQRPGFVVGAGLETPSDDLLPPRRFRVPALAAGGAQDAGTVVANLAAPSAAPLGTAVPLRFGDNQAVLIQFPSGFTFPFYGIVYQKMFVYDNGYVTFTNAASPVPDPIRVRSGTDFAVETLSEFLGSASARIGLLFRNHDPSADNRGQNTGVMDVYYSAQPGRVSITWAAVPEVVLNINLVADSVRADTMTLHLYADGVVEMEFGSLGTPYGIVGIKPEGTGVSFRRVDLSRAAAVQGAPLEALLEEFSAGRIDFQLGTWRIFHGLDLSGGKVRFHPGPDLAFTVSQPALRPGEVSGRGATPLQAAGADPTVLTWEAGMPFFNLYRGSIAGLRASGVYTPAGSCLVSGLTAASYADAGSPPAPGDAYYYLVTGENAAGVEGTLGFDSRGVERPNASACP